MQHDWTATTLDANANWYRPLSRTCCRIFSDKIERLRRDPRPVTELLLSPEERAICERELVDIRQTLEGGRGFVIVNALPSEASSAQEIRAIYWLLGQALGVPFEQNVQGTLLYDVRDTGQDVRYGARFSVTNAESTFHTDNSFGDEVLDYAALLCLQPAKSGGCSQLINGYSVAAELRRRDPAAWEVLQQPFHVERRAGVRPGEAATAQHPVVQCDGDRLIWRYLRYWIDCGHEKAGEPLSPEQVRALDALDAVLAEPSLRVEFSLQKGEMLWFNNRSLLHNRTAFVDHPEPERRRTYLGLWLGRK